MLAAGQGAVPAVAGLGLEIIKFLAGLDVFHGVAVQLDDAEHGFDVVLGHGLGDAGATGVAVAGEGADVGGDFGALLVGVAGHDGGDGAGQGAAFVGIIGQAVAHAERAEIGEAQAERAEDVGILGDVLGRDSWRCPRGFPAR